MSKQIAIILIAILVIAAIFIVLWKFKFATPGEEGKQQEQGPTLKKEGAGEGGIVDCGIFQSNQSLDEQNKIKNCWEENFKACHPAKMVLVVNEPNAKEPTEFYSEILGPGEGEHICRVKSKFLNNPKIEWINKEMICDYDNTLSFDFASQNMLERCSGPLIDLLTGGAKNK